MISGHTGPTYWIIRKIYMHTGMAKIRIFLILTVTSSLNLDHKFCYVRGFELTSAQNEIGILKGYC